MTYEFVLILYFDGQPIHSSFTSSMFHRLSPGRRSLLLNDLSRGTCLTLRVRRSHMKTATNLRDYRLDCGPYPHRLSAYYEPPDRISRYHLCPRMPLPVFYGVLIRLRRRTVYPLCRVGAMCCGPIPGESYRSRHGGG